MVHSVFFFMKEPFHIILYEGRCVHISYLEGRGSGSIGEYRYCTVEILRHKIRSQLVGKLSVRDKRCYAENHKPFVISSLEYNPPKGIYGRYQSGNFEALGSVFQIKFEPECFFWHATFISTCQVEHYINPDPPISSVKDLLHYLKYMQGENHRGILPAKHSQCRSIHFPLNNAIDMYIFSNVRTQGKLWARFNCFPFTFNHFVLLDIRSSNGCVKSSPMLFSILEHFSDKIIVRQWTIVKEVIFTYSVNPYARIIMLEAHSLNNNGTVQPIDCSISIHVDGRSMSSHHLQILDKKLSPHIHQFKNSTILREVKIQGKSYLVSNKLLNAREEAENLCSKYDFKMISGDIKEHLYFTSLFCANEYDDLKFHGYFLYTRDIKEYVSCSIFSISFK